MSESNNIIEWFLQFSIHETINAFLTLFAVIDIIGAIPIILSLREKGRDVRASKAIYISGALFLCYFFGGNMLLDLFNVDINSFAVAGAFILFLMALEMVLDVDIFKYQGPTQEATLIPFYAHCRPGSFHHIAFLRLFFRRNKYHTGAISKSGVRLFRAFHDKPYREILRKGRHIHNKEVFRHHTSGRIGRHVHRQHNQAGKQDKRVRAFRQAQKRSAMTGTNLAIALSV